VARIEHFTAGKRRAKKFYVHYIILGSAAFAVASRDSKEESVATGARGGWKDEIL
jgi:hypothetical protein